MSEKEVAYFAHPIRSYATPEALEILKALKEEYPDHEIIDPEDFDAPPWLSCEQCMQDKMKKIFFPAIERCTKFAIWAPIATCGIECELHYAWQCGKPIIYVSYFAGEIEFEEMNLQQYHYMEVATEVE